MNDWKDGDDVWMFDSANEQYGMFSPFFTLKCRKSEHIVNINHWKSHFDIFHTKEEALKAFRDRLDEIENE